MWYLIFIGSHPYYILSGIHYFSLNSKSLLCLVQIATSPTKHRDRDLRSRALYLFLVLISPPCSHQNIWWWRFILALVHGASILPKLLSFVDNTWDHWPGVFNILNCGWYFQFTPVHPTPGPPTFQPLKAPGYWCSGYSPTGVIHPLVLICGL